MPQIDMERIMLISKEIKNFKLKPMDLYDPRFYPVENKPLDRVLMYFLTMVAMDHRLSRPGKEYKAFIDGEESKGADLLYKLGIRMYLSNPNFFTPEHLSRIGVDEVLSWLSYGGASPPDPYTRTILLKDLGSKIITLFNGDPTTIIKLSNGYLRREDGYGLLDLLRIFKAYSDPVEKKSMLLVKFLSYRGILNVVDKENIRVPVDNHLTRIALRLGIVVLEDYLEEKVLKEVEVSYDEDILIRFSVREAYRILSQQANLNPLHLDDFLWNFGRSICLRGSPKCSLCSLNNVCKAYEAKKFLNEHTYYNTWFY